MALTGKDSIAGTCLSPGERLFTAACLAVPFIGSKIAGKLGEMCRFNGGCFVAGTPVQVATLEEASAQLAKNETTGKKGKKDKSSENLHTVTKPIEQVREGDLVASRNPVSGKTELRRVVSTSRHTVMKLIVLSLADARTGKVVQTLTTTAEHPFAVAGKGFVVAGQLAIGNAIVTRAGPALVVKSKQVQAQPKGIRVYNFSVDGDQTYFVGTANGGTWVHNASLCPLGAAKVDLAEVRGASVRARDVTNEWDKFLGADQDRTPILDWEPQIVIVSLPNCSERMA